MQIFNQTSYITLRINKQELEALRKYMHCAPNQQLILPRGMKLCYRGFGWYRFVPLNDHDVEAKALLAHKILTKFMKERERQQLMALRDAQTFERMKTALPNRVTIAYVSDDMRGFIRKQQVEIVKRSETLSPPAAAPISKLQALAEHFNSRRL